MFEFLNKSRDELNDECRIETKRGSGPGGTKADATESAVRITHEPTGITVQASDHRSQQANRKTAFRRLRLEYAVQVRHSLDPDRVKIPEQLTQYHHDGIDINPKNPHFPFWVKLVFDLLESCEGRVGDAAERLDVSTNQLVKFLGKDDRVWTQANKIRKRYAHEPLKKN